MWPLGALALGSGSLGPRVPASEQGRDAQLSATRTPPPLGPFSCRPLSLGSGGASRLLLGPSQQPEGGVSGFPKGWTPTWTGPG